ncbi:hypothetical protein CYFUS_009626 [Cystobacter fuscus]|uniref:HNH nuclease domain-containing protein n=1 Tax=Cystobacter fuscus TaxID=43 RepID=A0A250JJT4_9BACT|nr:hypothetical protein [Cystobacter fuscus]ATB44144.1 hypothetical protein CYFUS_009626 [Cystobacter fuscus]
MIHVAPQLEPSDFSARVREPGQALLASPEGELKPLWRHCATQLWAAYQGVCSYSSLYIPRGTGALSVDHLLPKSKRRELAYEWSNYRLACTRMNARKNDLEDVLDPFEVRDEWFALELSTLQVIPGDDLSEPLLSQVQQTIDRLNLNDEEFIEARTAYYSAWKDGDTTLRHLRKHCPFLAKELLRQGHVRDER